MPSISGIFDSRIKQIIIQCRVSKVGASKNWYSRMLPVQDSGIGNYKGLMDTGANGTCISSKIVNDLGLIHHSMTQNATAAGTFDANVYDIDLILTFEHRDIVIEKLNVVEVKLDHDFDVLIGMDVILQGHLSISPDHHFTFSV